MPEKKSGVTLLVSSQTAVKGGQSFQIAVRIENLRGWDWEETQNSAHRVRSLLSLSSLFSVVFMCLISPTLKFILGKSAKITKNEVSQDLMRFWSYEPLVETILLRWHFVNSSELRFDFVCFGTIKAWQRNLKKRLLILILCMFSCLFSTYSKMWILHPSL